MNEVTTKMTRHTSVLQSLAIKSGPRPDLGISNMVVFPSAEFALQLCGGRGMLTPTVFLNLDNGSAWAMKSPNSLWTDSRLLRAARMLAQVAEGAHSWQQAVEALRKELSVPMLSFIPAIEIVSNHRMWEREIAYISEALLNLPRSRKRQLLLGNETQSKQDIHQLLGDKLTVAYHEFIAGLDDNVSALANHNGLIDLRWYNYFTQKQYQTYRIQAMRSMPLLVSSIVNANPPSEEEHLGAAIDNGMPIIKYLCARWNVPPVIVRTIIRKNIAQLRSYWKGELGSLARTLAVLSPEHLPRSPEDWEGFDHAIQSAEKHYGFPVWDSFLGMAYLRHIAIRGWINAYSPIEGKEAVSAAMAPLVKIRSALIEICREEIGAWHTRGAKAWSLRPLRLIDDVVDTMLFGLGLKNCRHLADRFCQRLELEVQQLDQKLLLVTGDYFWPMLPRNYESLKWGRNVVPLSSRKEMRRHGAELGICLGNPRYLDRYVRRCQEDRCFILRFVEAGTGNPCSTSNISVSQRTYSRWIFTVLEHKSARNSSPSCECTATLKELLQWCESEEVQRHLDAGDILTGKRSSRTKPSVVRLEMLYARRIAAASTLGDLLLQGLYDECKEQLIVQ